MTDEVLLLQEQGPPREVGLEPADVVLLRRELSSRLDVWPTGDQNRYLLKAHSHVGFVALPSGRSIVIEPKARIDTLFALLAAVYDPARRVFAEDPQGYTSIAGLFEFVVRFFVRHVEDLIARGLLHGYRQHREDVVAVRGRLLMAETLRAHPGLHDRHWCAYSHFTADVPENRILRWTSHCLAGLQFQEAGLTGRLRRLHMGLAAAELDPQVQDSYGEIDFHRLNEHYRPALMLARLLLDHLSFSGTAGERPFIAFLVDMDWLFERYLGAVLKQAGPEWGVQVVEQEHHLLDHARQVSVRPDVVLYRQVEPLVVLDAKYKLDETRGDLYQMLAYCHALGLAKAILVHPASESAPSGTVAIRGPGNATIRYLALDLSGTPEQLVAQARSLCEQVATWLELELAGTHR